MTPFSHTNFEFGGAMPANKSNLSLLVSADAGTGQPVFDARLFRPFLIALAGALLCGCQSYKQIRFAPDSVNYTLARDRQTGGLTDYFGVGWNLK